MTGAELTASRTRLTPGAGPVLVGGPDLAFTRGVFERAVAQMRADGEDVDALIARAVENVSRLRRVVPRYPEE